jgi:MFS family permease
LLATENAPANKKAWYGMFPQLGAPIGFLLSSGTFFVLSKTLTDAQFLSYGWRIPFIASALLVWVGLYIRLKITETPDFIKVMNNQATVKVPVASVFTNHLNVVLLGTAATIITFMIFYIVTVFSLSWGTSALHYPRESFLIAQMISMLFFALGVPLSALLADRKGRNYMLILSCIGIFIFGLFFAPFFSTGSLIITVIFQSTGMLLTGLNYGSVGTALADIFPVEVRYTGASLCFTFAGILGASLTPYIATMLATQYGLQYVGYYLSFGAAISIVALMVLRKVNSEQRTPNIA